MSGRGRPQRKVRPPKRLQPQEQAAPQQLQKQPKRHKSGAAARPAEAEPAASSSSASEGEGESGVREMGETWWTQQAAAPLELVNEPASTSSSATITALLERIEALEKREADRKGLEKGQRLDELAITVSSDLRDKILGGKCVDLSLLLAKSFLEQPEEKSVMLVQDKEGRIVAKEEKRAQPVMSIAQWTSAFHVYMSVYLKGHPEALQGMLAYVELIRGAAKEHEGRAWAKYDQMFRSRKEADPTRPWDMMDSQLWLQLFCKPSGSGTHAFRSALQGQFPEHNASKKPNPEGSCHYYNKPRGCTRPNCPYKHRCALCLATDHSQIACKQKRGAYQPGLTHAVPAAGRPAQAQTGQARLQPFRFNNTHQ